MEEYAQVLFTVDSEDKAREIQRLLLEQRVVACVQVMGPISSAYWWQGQIEEAEEWICLAKTRASEYGRVESLIKQSHPYETPEIIAVPVLAGNREYLEWIRAETAT